MKNKEKYSNDILNIVCSSKPFAVDKKTGGVVNCYKLDCEKCLFQFDEEKRKDCIELKKEWAESEYKEPITAKHLQDEFESMCANNTCTRCKYIATNCNYGWLLDKYKVTEKESDNE